jgi:multimeric flavodoxin WrbA
MAMAQFNLFKVATDKKNMNITILNGDLSHEGSGFSNYIEKFALKISSTSNVEHFQLNQMNLHYCMGCWSCWWKTPGMCAIKDDAEIIFKSVIQSDFLIYQIYRYRQT